MAMYTPDRNIVRQLKECDPDLDVAWDRNRERWVITCLGKEVRVVRNNDGSFRPLDGREVERFREQAWEYRNFFGTLNRRDRQMHVANLERVKKQRASQRDDFRQYCIEDGYRNVFGPSGNRKLFGGWSANA